MTTLLDEIHAAAPTPPKRRPCLVTTVMNTISKEDAEDLVAALADPANHHTAIARALTNRGFAIGEKPIRRHRAGDCGCPR